MAFSWAALRGLSAFWCELRRLPQGQGKPEAAARGARNWKGAPGETSLVHHNEHNEGHKEHDEVESGATPLCPL